MENHINFIGCREAEVSPTFVSARTLLIYSGRTATFMTSLGPALVLNTTINGLFSLLLIPKVILIY